MDDGKVTKFDVLNRARKRAAHNDEVDVKKATKATWEGRENARAARRHLHYHSLLRKNSGKCLLSLHDTTRPILKSRSSKCQT